METSGEESASYNTADRELANAALRQSQLLTNKHFDLVEENKELRAHNKRMRKEIKDLRAENEELQAKLEARHGRAEQQSSAAAPTRQDAEEVDAAEEARRHAGEDRRNRERRVERVRAAADSTGFETARQLEWRTSGAQQGGGTRAPQNAWEQAQWNQREREREAEEHARKRRRTEGNLQPIAEGMSGASARPPPPGAGATSRSRAIEQRGGAIEFGSRAGCRARSRAAEFHSTRTDHATAAGRAGSRAGKRAADLHSGRATGAVPRDVVHDVAQRGEREENACATGGAATRATVEGGARGVSGCAARAAESARRAAARAARDRTMLYPT
jgi:hypothetical protein